MTPEEYRAYRKTVRTVHGEVVCADVGEGPATLFVHGVGTGGYLWRNVIGALKGERRCVAIDLPLHGLTPAAPGQDFSLPALAEFVEDFCEALGLAEVDLVANDTGGAVCQILAANHPGRLRTLTLTNCETHDNVPPQAFKPTVWLARSGMLTLLGPLLARRPALARKRVVGSGYEHPERLGDETIRAYLEPVLGTRKASREFARFLTSLRARDLLAVKPALKKLEVPTLVVWGTGDVFFEVKWAYWLRDTIPGVTEVVELDGGRLFFPDERAEELVPYLRRHWSVCEYAA